MLMCRRSQHNHIFLMLGKAEFKKKVTQIIEFIAQTIEDHDKAGLIEVDINSDELNITTKHGMFVFSKQEALEEIWLSSPVSGPHHFFYNGKLWQSKKSGRNLFDILSDDLDTGVVFYN